MDLRGALLPCVFGKARRKGVTMKGPAWYGRIVNCFMNILMCALLATYVLYTVQHLPGNEQLPILTPLSWFVSFIDSFFVGMFIGDWIPGYALGCKLAGSLKLKGFLHHMVSVFVLAFIMITSISFICTYIANVQNIGMAGVIGTWTMVYPALLGIGYVLQLVTLPLGFKLAKAISGFDPAAAQPE